MKHSPGLSNTDAFLCHLVCLERSGKWCTHTHDGTVIDGNVPSSISPYLCQALGLMVSLRGVATLCEKL